MSGSSSISFAILWMFSEVVVFIESMKLSYWSGGSSSAVMCWNASSAVISPDSMSLNRFFSSDFVIVSCLFSWFIIPFLRVVRR